MKIHHLRKVYSDESYIDVGVCSFHLQNLIETLQKENPTVALFVDAVCVHPGSLEPLVIQHLTHLIKGLSIEFPQPTRLSFKTDKV